MSKKVNEIITERIIAKMEEGKIPWQSPYLCKEGLGAMNFETKRRYTAVNALLLADADCPFYLTFNQIKKLGGYLKKGARKDIAVFWTQLEYANTREKSNGTTETSTAKIPYLRYYEVFNLKHVENIPWQAKLDFGKRSDVQVIAAAKAIWDNCASKPPLEHAKVGKAYYVPVLDIINVPPPEYMISDEAYYCTLFHELAHSTGHKTRLNRELTGLNSRTIKEYSKEELIAEITTTFLANSCGLTQQFDNSVAYLQSWLRSLKNDPNMIISAAAKAQKAYDFIMGTAKEQERPDAAKAA